ncbi:MAG: hypothetical protein LBF61_01245 [Azoarcus sp.]|nr:hypothetical protein [Azoarcus sp.]
MFTPFCPPRRIPLCGRIPASMIGRACIISPETVIATLDAPWQSRFLSFGLPRPDSFPSAPPPAAAPFQQRALAWTLIAPLRLQPLPGLANATARAVQTQLGQWIKAQRRPKAATRHTP